MEWRCSGVAKGVKRLRGARLGLCGGKDQAWNGAVSEYWRCVVWSGPIASKLAPTGIRVDHTSAFQPETCGSELARDWP
ncbi:hypothetical protein EMIT0P253_130078 [Pseudomonas sp. IT-P253]